MQEGHFLDFKSIDVSPGKLSRTISAFANADGGEVYIGIEDDPRVWRGFDEIEKFNGHIQAFESIFPLGHGFDYAFLSCESQQGWVLKVEVQKAHEVVLASDRKVYLRRSAQNLPQDDGPPLERLKRNKGLTSFETEIINTSIDAVTESEVIKEFMSQVLPATDGVKWLRKQQLLKDEKPTVAGALLFSDEPQALLPKRSGIKIYRYMTREEGERSVLAFDPITVEGCAYNLIKIAVNETVQQIEKIKIMTPCGLAHAKYPR